MRIALSLIRESSQKIRTSWDEEALEELKQSIKEQGVIVPVKVRPDAGIEECSMHGLAWLSVDGPPIINDSEPCWRCGQLARPQQYCESEEDFPFRWAPEFKPFELVYGHRRTEAARRAGLTEIEAIVEDMEDTDALVQALIENVMREDLEPMDKARAIKSLQEKTEWGLREIERRGIMQHATSSLLLSVLNEGTDIQDLMASSGPELETPEGKISLDHVRRVRGTGLDGDAQHQVLKKAASENLTSRQARQVAESIVKAKNPEHRETLLRTPYSSFLHNPEYVEANERAFIAGQPSPQRTWNESPTAKALVTVFTTWDKTMADMVSTASIGKLAPEAIRFIANQLRRFAEKLLKRAGELEGLANENLA
jgi:ParB-like chromosome segregation protein Spo0J